MSLTLPDLPYAYSALEPHISSETLHIHHDKHHGAYVNAVNNLIDKAHPNAGTLEEIIARARNDQNRALFNSAAQAWNHAFYWSSMTPGGGGQPKGKLAEKISADFGNFQDFSQQFTAAATGQFGSGWAWLVYDAGHLKIRQTSNAETPIGGTEVPLLTIDVWEHAYYVDYRNERPRYVTAFLASLANWDFANRNLESAVAKSDGGKSFRAPPLSAKQSAR